MFRQFSSVARAAGRLNLASRPALVLPINPQTQMVGVRQIANPTQPLQMGLEEFRDPVSRQQRMNELVGRKWSVRELRRKSYDDLHKLWIVLYKEKNMLLTELQLSRRKQILFPQPERFDKVKKSMGAIKAVLGERKRAAIAAFAERKMLEELENQSQKEDDENGLVDEAESAAAEEENEEEKK